MADIENKIILKVQTDNVSSIGELRQKTKDLKKELDGMAQTDAGYAQKLIEVKNAQNSLRDAMKLSGANLKELSLDTDIAGKSYNELQRTMSLLKEAYKDTTDAMQRATIGKTINVINNELKALDKSIGDNQRNVGDYSEQIKSAFGQMGGAAGKLSTGVSGLKSGFDVLSKTPVLAVLGLLVNAFSKIITSIKSSEENAQALTKAMASFNGVMDIVTRVLQGAGKVLVSVFDKVSTFVQKLSPKLRKEAEARIELAEKEKRLTEESRAAMMQNADDELEISKLKYKAQDKATYSAQERYNFLLRALALEEQISKRNMMLAQEEYERQKLAAERAGNSAEENDKLAESYVKLRKAEQDYYNKGKEIIAQRNEAYNQMIAPLKAAEQAIAESNESWLEELEEQLTAEMELATQFAEEQFNFETTVNAKRIESQRATDKKMTEEERQALMDRIAVYNGYASAISGLLSGVADAIESSGEGDEKSAKAVKAIRIATATIDTISGAITAYMANAANPVIAAISAATVTAAGMANIAKIKATKIGGEGSSSTAPTFSTGATQPPMLSSVPQMAMVTGASNEYQLNQIRDQKVYLVMSELEVKGRQVELVQQETTFP